MLLQVLAGQLSFLDFGFQHFRKKSKGFGFILFIFLIIKIFILYTLSKQNNEDWLNLLIYGTFEPSYGMITPVVLAAAIYPLETWIAYFL